MKIFLGSSKERLQELRLVASWIEEYGFSPLCWDDPELFLPGENTFPKLIEISKSVDAAIFIFGEDDRVWYRQDSNVPQPRDNVLIEYGLFVGSLGQNKAIICRHGNPRIASDLLSIVFADLKLLQKARLQLNAWMNKIQTQPATDNETFQKKIDKEIIRRELDSVKEQLEFEGKKSLELQSILSKNGIIDFENYDLSNDGHWKLLFDYTYFWEVVSAICDEYKNPNELRLKLDANISKNINWESFDSSRTKFTVAKILRWIRKYSNPQIYQEFLSQITVGSLSSNINSIAKKTIQQKIGNK